MMERANKGNCMRLLAALLLGLALFNLCAAAAFTDAGQIRETEAVNTLVDLGVLEGKEDGSFDPKGAVTRAEMCKIISVILNGGPAGGPEASHDELLLLRRLRPLGQIFDRILLRAGDRQWQSGRYL